MELRRALLLFAIVLGIAAIAGSIANPPSDEEDSTAEPETGRDERATEPSTAPQPRSPAATAATIRFAAGGPAEARTLRAGRPATVLVEVEAPAQVEIPSLGLNGFAEPLTPARFDVLERDPGSHPVVLRAAERGAEPRELGVLEVRAPR